MAELSFEISNNDSRFMDINNRKIWAMFLQNLNV